MAKGIHLILGVHNHQPVDNWDHVIEDAYRQCYQPCVDVLEAHPSIAMAMHYTGYLLDWIEAHHPDHLAQLSRLVARGQVEMMTGAYYEPILATIPDQDKVGQIRALTRRVEALTGVPPQGLWLAERVWEPHLARFIAEAGAAWMCLDDAHFRSVGLEEGDLFGYYVTEEQGHPVEVFPVNQELRYRIPFDRVENIVEYLLDQATDGGHRAAIYLDDGEKFGVWPGTHKHVYKEKWLHRFFTALEAHADIIRSVTPSQYRAKFPPLGRVYLPTASYSEMLTWALPAHLAPLYREALGTVAPPSQRFLKAGFWRHFLVKYPEANNLHKKMLYVAEKISRAESLAGQDLADARKHLWKGQSNDVFWHGVFGGLYLTNLRSVNYKHLIQAENLADEVLHPNGGRVQVHTLDFDLDGRSEILLESPVQNLYLDPDEGGALFELDFREKAFNLLDTLARRPESYHEEMIRKAKEVGREPKPLFYDWHRRLSLLDHFLGPETTLDSLKKAQFPEQGDFINQPYTAQILEDGVSLVREGHVWVDGKRQPLVLRKTITLVGEESRIAYQLTNLSKEPLALWFAPEFNVNLLAPHADDRYYYLPEEGQEAKLTHRHLASSGKLAGIGGIGLRDEFLGIDYSLQFSEPADLWRFPVETVSQSESGYDTVYQSSALFPNWHLSLAPGASWSVILTQRLTAWEADGASTAVSASASSSGSP